MLIYFLLFKLAASLCPLQCTNNNLWVLDIKSLSNESTSEGTLYRSSFLISAVLTYIIVFITISITPGYCNVNYYYITHVLLLVGVETAIITWQIIVKRQVRAYKILNEHVIRVAVDMSFHHSRGKINFAD